MQSFTDIKKRMWIISVTVATVKRAKALLHVDLMQPNTVIHRLADPIFLCDLLYVVCKEQADKEGITDEEFGCSMGGDALWEGQKALTEEYIDFFQNPEVRKNLRAITDKMNNALSKMQEMLSKRTANLDKEIEIAMTEFEKTLGDIGNGSTNSPELLQ